MLRVIPGSKKHLPTIPSSKHTSTSPFLFSKPTFFVTFCFLPVVVYTSISMSLVTFRKQSFYIQASLWRLAREILEELGLEAVNMSEDDISHGSKSNSHPISRDDCNFSMLTVNVSSIKEWIPDLYRSNASLVVGWEFDVGWGENIVREFATWTIAARPHSPHLWSLVVDINDALREKQKAYGLASIAQLEPSMAGDVVDITGPRRFTSSILRSLGVTLGEVIDIGAIKNLREPKLVGDVLILPGYSFAAGSNHYDADEVLPAPLVTHHGAGTWKNEQGGETI